MLASLLRLESLSSHSELLIQIIDLHHPATAAHLRRVGPIALEMGEAIAISEGDRHDLHQAALLHDIGKLTISTRILDKSLPLDRQERMKLREHAASGAGLLEQNGFNERVVAAVRHHHEHYDGCGYPDGLEGSAIPLLSRIIHIADSFDAMTNSRSYSAATTLAYAKAEIDLLRGSQFCPRATLAFRQRYNADALERHYSL